MWYLIFEREARHRAPGTVIVSGSPAGAGEQHPPPYRTFKPVMIVEAESWKEALENAIKATRKLGEYAAVRCDVFTDDLFKT